MTLQVLYNLNEATSTVFLWNVIVLSDFQRQKEFLFSGSFFSVLANPAIWYKRWSSLYNRSKRILWVDFLFIGLCNWSKKLWDLSAITHDFLFNSQWLCLSLSPVPCNFNVCDLRADFCLFLWATQLVFEQWRNSKSIRTSENSIKICPVEGLIRLPTWSYQSIPFLNCACLQNKCVSRSEF